jgi:molybdopterin molybdotransferase
MERFVKPLIRTLAGERPTDPGPTGRVPLLENVASRPGREEYVRVRLEWSGGRPAARPVRGPSGAVSTLVRADGLLRIPLDCEGLAAGAEAEYFAL